MLKSTGVSVSEEMLGLYMRPISNEPSIGLQSFMIPMFLVAWPLKG